MSQSTPLKNRARIFGQVIAQVFIQQKLSGGKLVEASRGARHLSLGVRLTNPTELDKALKIAEAIALAANSENVLATRQAGLIRYQFQLAQGYWESYTRADLPTSEAVGLAERRHPVTFAFSPPHALFAGTTDSGKTEGIKSTLIGILQIYTPQQLGLVIIDQKNVLQDFTNEAHLKLPIAIEGEDAINAILWANHQLAERRSTGNKNAFTLLIVIDEVSLLPEGKAMAALTQIAKLGREYRVHLIVGNQRASQSNLPEIIDNLNNRFIGQVDKASTSTLLTGHAGLNAHKLTGAGDFLHIAKGQAVRFQMAQATQADFDSLSRSEINPITVEPDLIEFPTDLQPKAVGRPRLEVQPEIAAWYFLLGPDNISRSRANELLQLSRDNHDLHRKFVRDFVKAYRQLRLQQLEQI
ncbi:MAG: FtsK/SpoIIIE domain-containing protein, partial [Chloroflexota bacterium]